MSFSLEINLLCDNDDHGQCGGIYSDLLDAQTTRSGLKEIRQVARRLGWGFLGGKDYCPACHERIARTLISDLNRKSKIKNRK